MTDRHMPSSPMTDSHTTTCRAMPSLPTSSRGLAGALLSWWHSRTAPSPRQMRLLETLPLGPKRSVALLELDGERFLVGMGADGVHTLLQVNSSAAAHRGDHS